MQDDLTLSTKSNSYLFNTESAPEMARLIRLDQLTTQAMGGVFAGLPEREVGTFRTVLDVACGPGGWALDVAFTFPLIKVVGIDVSQTMIEFAGIRARSEKRSRVAFGIMDITQPLDFSDTTFDLVNARFLVGVLKQKAWPFFLRECLRILKPGGILRLTEADGVVVSSSPALQYLTHSLMKVMGGLEYGFGIDGHSLAITPTLPRLLRAAGCQTIHRHPFMFDFSRGEPTWAEGYHQMEIVHHEARPLLVRAGIAEEEELAFRHRQMLSEMSHPQFVGSWTGLSVWAKRPSQEPGAATATAEEVELIPIAAPDFLLSQAFVHC